MIKVGFNNLGFLKGTEEMAKYMNNGVEGFIRAAHDLGFKAYQIETGYCGLFTSAESFCEVDVSKIRKKLEDSGIEMHLHNHSPNASPDVFQFAEKGKIYHEHEKYLKAAIKFIHSVGGHVVTFHPPFVDTGGDPDERPIDYDTRQKTIQVFADFMQKLGSFAENLGIKLGIESAVWGPPRRPWTSIFVTPEELNRFVKASEIPSSVGILAEISHLHHMGFNIPECLTMWGDKVVEIHTSDAIVHQWINKKNYVEKLLDETHRVIGKGTLDFRSVIKTLKRLNFDGWLSLEIFECHAPSIADFVASREILEKIVSETK